MSAATIVVKNAPAGIPAPEIEAFFVAKYQAEIAHTTFARGRNLYVIEFKSPETVTKVMASGVEKPAPTSPDAEKQPPTRLVRFKDVDLEIARKAKKGKKKSKRSNNNNNNNKAGNTTAAAPTAVSGNTSTAAPKEKRPPRPLRENNYYHKSGATELPEGATRTSRVLPVPGTSLVLKSIPRDLPAKELFDFLRTQFPAGDALVEVDISPKWNFAFVTYANPGALTAVVAKIGKSPDGTTLAKVEMPNRGNFPAEVRRTEEERAQRRAAKEKERESSRPAPASSSAANGTTTTTTTNGGANGGGSSPAPKKPREPKKPRAEPAADLDSPTAVFRFKQEGVRDRLLGEGGLKAALEGAGFPVKRVFPHATPKFTQMVFVEFEGGSDAVSKVLAKFPEGQPHTFVGVEGVTVERQRAKRA